MTTFHEKEFRKHSRSHNFQHP